MEYTVFIAQVDGFQMGDLACKIGVDTGTEYKHNKLIIIMSPETKTQLQSVLIR